MPSQIRRVLWIAFCFLVETSALADSLGPTGSIDPAFDGYLLGTSYLYQPSRIYILPDQRLLATYVTPYAHPTFLNTNGTFQAEAFYHDPFWGIAARFPDDTFWVASLWYYGSVEPSIRLTANGAQATWTAHLDGFAAVTAATDSKLYVFGTFSVASGVPRRRIARVFGDGSLDATFDPGQSVSKAGSGMGATVDHALSLSDGKVLIQGSFDRVGPIPRPGIAALSSDGALNLDFNPGSGPAQSDNNSAKTIETMAIDNRARILVAGSFSTWDGTSQSYLVRLDGNGKPDSTFRPTFNGPVIFLRALPSGKLLVGGYFTQVNGTSQMLIARLDENGGVDLGLKSGISGLDRVAALVITGTDRSEMYVAGINLNSNQSPFFFKTLGDGPPGIIIEQNVLNGTIILKTTNINAASVTFERSTNFLTWDAVVSVTNSDGNAEAPINSDLPKAFLRARISP